MQFGSGKFGRGKFGGSPWPQGPGLYISRIISKLDRFKKVGSTGCVKTIERLTGDLKDPEVMKLIAQAGAPAFLVHYSGSDFTKGTKTLSGKRHQGIHTFTIICIADKTDSRIERLEGKRRSEYSPGLDNLVGWALHYGGLALANDTNLMSPRPRSVRYASYDASKFIGLVVFVGEGGFDLYEDHDETKLIRLGICHNPADRDNLFSDVNTPNTTDPTSPAIGYTDLRD